VQVFTATGNANLVVIDKLTGWMYSRNNIAGANWNTNIDNALAYSVVVNSITYDDWLLITESNMMSIFHNFTGVAVSVDPATSVQILPTSSNIATSSTNAATTTDTNYWVNSFRVMSFTAKSSTLNPIYMRNCKNLITAP
jgi:hypothetical protein